MSTPKKIFSFLEATTTVSRIRGRIFNLEDVCRCLQWNRTECDEMAARLEKLGLLNRLPNAQAILTTAGLNMTGEG